MIIGIHQPNLVPWLPYFEKMRQCDVFVILGHCDYTKGGYQNRFAYRDSWCTLGVKSGTCKIADKLYSNPQGDWETIKRRLNRLPALTELDQFVSPSLLQTNLGIIRHLAAKLGITTAIVTDFLTESRSTERLVELCQYFKATTYLAGSSGPDYMDMRLFDRAGVAVKIQDKPKDTRSVLEVLQ